MNVSTHGTHGHGRLPARANEGWPQWVSVALGAWLFISAFLWQHTEAQMTNTWILGVLIAGTAIVAVYAVPKLRYLNVALAIWLFISAWVLPNVTDATVWNNVLVAVFTFVLSMLPRSSEPIRTGRREVVVGG